MQFKKVSIRVALAILTLLSVSVQADPYGLSLPSNHNTSISPSDLKNRAVRGDIRAQYQLGMMYKEGKGVGVDSARAKDYLLSAAQKGLGEAQVALAGIYEKANRYAEAIHWYTLAAQRGFSLAQFNLGLIFEEGRGGTKRDISYALSWYEEAARNGDAQALARISRLSER